MGFTGKWRGYPFDIVPLEGLGLNEAYFVPEFSKGPIRMDVEPDTCPVCHWRGIGAHPVAECLERVRAQRDLAVARLERKEPELVSERIRVIVRRR